MTSGKPPRRTKASSVPVTIDLDADRARDKPQPDGGLTAEPVIAEDSATAAPEGSPKSELDEIDNANRDLGDTGPFPATSSETLTDKESDPNRSDTLSADELTEPPPRPSVSETPRAYEQPNATEPTSTGEPRHSRGPSTSALIAAGIFGGLVALAAAGSMQYAGYLPSSGPARSAGSEDATAAKLGELESRIAQLQQQPADQGNAEIDTRISGLETALAELRQGVSESGSQATEQLQGELAAVNETVAQLRAQIATNTQTASATEERLAAAEQKIDEPRADIALARALAVTSLKGAVDRGGPFVAELDALASIAPEDPAVTGLRDQAAVGVLSRAELLRRFPDTANTILTAVNQPVGEEQGLGSRLLSSAFSMVKVRPVGNVEGDTPDAIVARMEDKMRNGDLKGAEVEWQALPESGRTASAEYHERLKARIDVETVIDQAVGSVVGEKS